MPHKSCDIDLASNWPVSRVRRALRQKMTSELVTFIRERHNERFFEPIRCLKKTVGNEQGYGFAMMALCSLLVETIQSYRDGLPTTHSSELNHLRQLRRVPASFQIPARLRVNGRKAFQRFFRTYRGLFPGVSGARFYKNIRNGLLHQAQTKNGWRIRVDRAELCNRDDKVINRNLLARALEEAFETYLKELRDAPLDSDIWQNARRKIWWLIRLSQ